MTVDALDRWAAKIAKAALPLRDIEFGPWRGSMRSKTPDQVPRDYIADGDDFLYVPRTKGFKRRNGQTIKFDATGLPTTTGLLPALWTDAAAPLNAKARWLEEFKSDSLSSDGVPTVMGLVTKEAFVTTDVDDGRFSQVYVRNQVSNANYTLGDEFSDTTYPEPGTAQSYKIVPLWYQSGDGGHTRGTTEFARRFFFPGSRRFLKVGNWTYFPSLNGTPSRWSGDRALASSTVSTAVPISLHSGGTLWTNSAGNGVDMWTYIDETTPDDADWIEQNGVGGAIRFNMTSLSTPSSGLTHRLNIRVKLVDSGGASTFNWTLLSGGVTVKTVSSITPSTSFETLTYDLSAGEIALIGSYTDLDILMDSSGVAGDDYHVSWVSLQILDPAGAQANRLIPSGPLPPLHSGTLAKGSTISDDGTIPIRPDADVTDGGWLNQAASATNIYQSIDESTLDTTDYIESAPAGAAGTVGLSDPGYVPTVFDTVQIRFTWQIVKSLAGVGSVAIRLMEGATQRAIIQAFISAGGAGTTAWQTNAYTLTPAEQASITDWTALRLQFNAFETVATVTAVRVAQAYVSIGQAIVQTQGGWKGSDRFYHGVAFRFEDDSVWMPCTARPPSQTLLNGFNIFTVDLANPGATYDRVSYSNLPIGPHGTKSRLLLRSPKISAVQDDNLQLDPFDMRVIAEIKDNTTTTYDDFYGTDESLTLDAAKAFIRFDHIMPPRARYIFGGDMRVCHSYGGQNPCAIVLAPVGRTTDYDLNLLDTDATAYTENGSYMQVQVDSSGAGSLVLSESDGSAVVGSNTTFAFTTYTTLQKLVDAINDTNCADDGKQWRAQLCPGANPDASTLSLTPHSRAIASCVVSGQTVTLAAGGLSKVGVGAHILRSGVATTGVVTRIDSDTQLTFTGTVTSGTVTLTFYNELGDSPTTALADAGWQRVIAGSLPGFLYFTSDYLDNEPLDKQAVWYTVASPGQAKSAANNFGGRGANKFIPPDADAGISMGGGPVDQGFVVPYEDAVYAIKNITDGGSGLDEQYRITVINKTRGCCAWNTVGTGSRSVHYLTPHGMFAADLEGEFMLSKYTFVHAPEARGDFTYEVPLCVAATAADTDGAYATARVLEGTLYLNYRASGTHPNRQVQYDFSDSSDSGLRALRASDGDPLGWSVPLVRSLTAMARVVRTDGAHLYGWNDENIGSAGDGRIDEFDTGDTDNGTAIAGFVETGWEKGVKDLHIAGQEVILEHNAPTGSTGTLEFTRSYSEDLYSLTPSTSNTLDVIRDRKLLPTLGARVASAACKLGYRQATGGARTVRKMTLKVKDVPAYK